LNAKNTKNPTVNGGLRYAFYSERMSQLAREKGNLTSHKLKTLLCETFTPTPRPSPTKSWAAKARWRYQLYWPDKIIAPVVPWADDGNLSSDDGVPSSGGHQDIEARRRKIIEKENRTFRPRRALLICKGRLGRNREPAGNLSETRRSVNFDVLRQRESRV